jgi:HEAT repeats
LELLVLKSLISCLNRETLSYLQTISSAIQQIRDRHNAELLQTFEEDNTSPNISKMHNDLRNGDYFNRIKAMEQLADCGDTTIIPELLEILNSGDYMIRFNSAISIGKVASPEVLPRLLEILLDSQNDPILYAINGIQARCKYYNYDIAQTPLPPEDKPNPTAGNTYIFNDKVEQVVGKNLIVQGDNIAAQNNQKTVPES